MPQTTPSNSDLEEILNALTDPQIIFRRAMSLTATTTDILRGLRSKNNHERRRIVDQLVRHDRGEECLFEAVAKDSIRDIRAHAASSPYTSLTTLESMLKDPSFYVRIHLASNPKTTSDMLRTLVEDGPQEVRAQVALRAEHAVNPAPYRYKSGSLFVSSSVVYDLVDEDIVRVLATNPDWWIRLRIAQTELPDDLALKMCKDRNENIALSLARKANLPQQGIFALAQHAFSKVRVAAASHPQANEEIYRLLEGDTSVEVVTIVAQRTTDVTMLTRLARHSAREVRKAVATNPYATERTLLSIRSSHSENLRFLIARHPNTSANLLRKLCMDSSSYVRMQARKQVGLRHDAEELLSRCPHTTQSGKNDQLCCPDATTDLTIALYTALDNDNVSDEMLLASHDVRLPLHLRANLAQIGPHTETRLMRYAHDPSWQIRSVVATHPEIPREAAERLLTDRSSVIRHLLLENDQIPPDIFRKLAKDRSATIRSRARQRIRYICSPGVPPKMSRRS
jgi:hypothetical protein